MLAFTGNLFYAIHLPRLLRCLDLNKIWSGCLVWPLPILNKIWPGCSSSYEHGLHSSVDSANNCFVSPPFTLSTSLQEPMVLNHPSIWTLQILNLPVAYLAHLTQNLHLLIRTRQASNHWHFRLRQGSHSPLSFHVTRSCRNQFTGFC